MSEFLENSPVFWPLLTFLLYLGAQWVKSRTSCAVFNPILMTAIGLIVILKLLGVRTASYLDAMASVQLLLTPATIALAVSLYEEIQQLRSKLPAILIGTATGTLAGMGTVYCMAGVLNLDYTLTVSLLPKGVTTAIGTALSQQAGGIVSVTTAAIILTGILGNIAGPSLARLLRLTSDEAKGTALGTSSHVIGTAKAAEMGETIGAVSSLSLTFAGLITALCFSFFA